MKKSLGIIALLIAAVMIVCTLAACGESAQKDAFAGTWKQTDEVDGDWTWTFDGSGKCTADNTVFKQEGTYSINESAGTATIKLELWDNEIVYTYKLTDTTLELSSTYSGFHLVKQ